MFFPIQWKEKEIVNVADYKSREFMNEDETWWVNLFKKAMFKQIISICSFICLLWTIHSGPDIDCVYGVIYDNKDL